MHDSRKKLGDLVKLNYATKITTNIARVFGVIILIWFPIDYIIDLIVPTGYFSSMLFSLITLITILIILIKSQRQQNTINQQGQKITNKELMSIRLSLFWRIVWVIILWMLRSFINTSMVETGYFNQKVHKSLDEINIVINRILDNHLYSAQFYLWCFNTNKDCSDAAYNETLDLEYRNNYILRDYYKQYPIKFAPEQ